MLSPHTYPPARSPPSPLPLPPSLRVVDSLGGKELVMGLVNHGNSDVRMQALLAIQKMMVQNWYASAHAKPSNGSYTVISAGNVLLCEVVAGYDWKSSLAALLATSVLTIYIVPYSPK